MILYFNLNCIYECIGLQCELYYTTRSVRCLQFIFVGNITIYVSFNYSRIKIFVRIMSQ